MTPDIDRALQILARADVPPRLEDYVRGRITVIMSLAVHPARFSASMAAEAGRSIAWLARIAQSDDLARAARALGFEDAPEAPAEHKP